MSQNDRKSKQVEVQEEGSYLIVKPQNVARAAVKLSTVSRLERFAVADVTSANGQHVIRYQERILPLVGYLENAGHLLNTGVGSQYFDVVIYKHRGHLFGYVVGEVIDIVHEIELAQSETDALMGSQMIDNQITQLIDLNRNVSSHFPELFASLA